MLDETSLSFDAAVSGAGKEEAGKPMGYQELPKIECALRSGSLLDVKDIPGMRCLMTMGATAKYISGTQTHSCYWPVRLLGFISPASSGFAKASRSHNRWQVL